MTLIGERLIESFWEELEYQAGENGCYVDRTTGVIEGRFDIPLLFSELVERFGLKARL